jgi:hypothetical protein
MKTTQIFLFALMGCVSISNFYGQAVYNGTSVHRFTTDHGTIDIGPFNPHFAHIYTDRTRFIFNKPVYLTDGTLVAYGSSDLLLQTNNGTTRMTISSSNGNVGIGTANPSSSLEINKPDSSIKVITDDSHQPFISFGMGQTDRWGLGSYEATNSLHARTFFIYEDHTGANGSNGVRLAIRPDGNVGIGTVDPGTYKLAVNGNVRAKEIKVETGWSDFVFEKNYQLPTLEEVEAHIKDKGHLKDIPSAEEVAENGILLGEMDSKLLQKIEELTLYIIDINKRMELLEKENAELRKER